jgi:hypothetical protein
MGPTVDPVNAIFHPYTAGRGISLSAFEPLMPALQQTGGSVPAAAVVEALGKLTDEFRSFAAGQQGAAAAAAYTSSRPSSSKQAAAAPEAAAGLGSQGEAATEQAAGAGSSSSSSKELAFPNFGQKSVQQAAVWYHDTPLADRLTAREDGDCKGWTPAQMQAQKKDEWRGGNRGPRHQRWAEWVQLMQYLAARQWELSQERRAVVSLMDAAAVLDQERGSSSLTQFYKGTVVPWAQQQEAERKEAARKEAERKKAERKEGAVLGEEEEEMEVDGEAAATQ